MGLTLVLLVITKNLSPKPPPLLLTDAWQTVFLLPLQSGPFPMLPPPPSLKMTNNMCTSAVPCSDYPSIETDLLENCP